MEASILAKSFHKDYQFVNFFQSLKDAEILEKDAIILRQLFAEILAGTTEEKGSTGFKNPISLSGTQNLTQLWANHGLYTTLDSICLAAIRRGASFNGMRRFARAYYKEEKFARGFFFKAEYMMYLANRRDSDEYGDSWTHGVFDEDNKLVKYLGHNVYKVGKAYFVEGITGVSHWYSATEGWMWVPTKRLKY
jgi:hypothetical protein